MIAGLHYINVQVIDYRINFHDSHLILKYISIYLLLFFPCLPAHVH